MQEVSAGEYLRAVIDSGRLCYRVYIESTMMLTSGAFKNQIFTIQAMSDEQKASSDQ